MKEAETGIIRLHTVDKPEVVFGQGSPFRAGFTKLKDVLGGFEVIPERGR